MDQVSSLITQPIVQFDFLGMSGILLTIIVWLIKQLLNVVKRNSEVITMNTSIISEQNKALNENQKAIWQLHDKVSELCVKVDNRPCMLKK